ncbi:MAG: M20/M25/M40 family metallo-hydrolase, partial [Hyphomicrobiales bacterium]|nr:M20/M25/M40 family metallo-hydrolase [Hyphomicrobiales bacterium]
DPDAIQRGEPQLDRDRIAGFIEVHIEQGPALIGADLPVGLVSAINGGFRHMQARVSGGWDHSGATPRAFRRDAVLGFNAIVRKLEDAWDRIEHEGQTATITFGQVATDASLHGGSRVAGELTFSLDVRSQFDNVLERLRQDLVQCSAEAGLEHGVQVDLGEAFTWPLAAMSQDLIAALEESANVAGVPTMQMPSGAGHDAAVMAQAGVPTAMLFVRNENGSHNPHETMEVRDLDQAVQVLSQYVRGACP